MTLSTANLAVFIANFSRHQIPTMKIRLCSSLSCVNIFRNLGLSRSDRVNIKCAPSRICKCCTMVLVLLAFWLNCHGLWILDFRYFCGIRLVLMSLTSADKFWVVFDFCLCVKDNVKLLGSIPNVDCGMWWSYLVPKQHVKEEQRARRLSTSTIDENLDKMKETVLVNCRVAVREVAEDLNLSIDSCHSFFTKDLGLRRFGRALSVTTKFASEGHNW